MASLEMKDKGLLCWNAQDHVTIKQNYDKNKKRYQVDARHLVWMSAGCTGMEQITTNNIAILNFAFIQISHFAEFARIHAKLEMELFEYTN